MYSYKKVRTCFRVCSGLNYTQASESANILWSVKEMENYTKTNIGSEARAELHQ